jgi:hypothetical protein
VSEGVCPQKIAELIRDMGLRNASMPQKDEPPNGPKQNQNQRGRQRLFKTRYLQNFPRRYPSITRGAKKSSEVKIRPIFRTTLSFHSFTECELASVGGFSIWSTDYEYFIPGLYSGSQLLYSEAVTIEWLFP